MRNRSAKSAAIGLAAVIVGASIGGLVKVRQEISRPEYKYARAVVDEVNSEYDTVLFIDEAGESWVAEVESSDDFEVGSKHILTFDDMGTPDIYDDELVDIF